MRVTDFLDPVFAVPIGLIALLAGPGMWFAIRAQRASDKTLLDDWAAENGFKILKARRRHLFLGPAFSWEGGRVKSGACQDDVAWES
jgi:hypothetical protein